MKKEKTCRRCKQTLPTAVFVDTSGATNPRGHYCSDCHQVRVEEWHQAALKEEELYVRKLKIVYGDHWQHYAGPEDFYTSLKDERDFCPYCGTTYSDVIPEKFNQNPVHLDHMDPLQRGGEHSIRNTVLCCGPCNIRKGKRPFSKWVSTLQPEFQTLSLEIYLVSIRKARIFR